MWVPEAAEKQLSHFRCPQCHKKMAVLEKKSGPVVHCNTCSHTERLEDFKANLQVAKSGGRVNKQLIDTYADKKPVGTNLGDLLKAALNKPIDN